MGEREREGESYRTLSQSQVEEMQENIVTDESHNHLHVRSEHVLLTQPAHVYTREVRLDVSLKVTLPVGWAGFLLASYKRMRKPS